MPDEAIDEYWKAFGDAERRPQPPRSLPLRRLLEVEPYEGKLAALGVPALIVWGAKDEFAPVGGAYRFHKQIADRASSCSRTPATS